VDQAVQIGLASFRESGWAKADPRDRAKVMRKWAELIVAHGHEISVAESVTSPRLYAMALGKDIPNAAEIIRFAAEAADKLDGAVQQTASNVLAMTLHEPYGVVGGIVPWNAPIGLALAKIAPAIAVGNSVVVKPAELTPYSIMRIAQLALEAGVPPGTIGILPGLGQETGRAIVTHPDVDYISFTGSTTAGKKVAALAMESGCKPVHLELGGKSPQLVFEDAADLDALAETVTMAFTRNAGQVCFAGTRLIVHRKISEELIARVIDRCSKPSFGPTWSRATTMGPIASAAQCDRIVGILSAAVKEGARILLGGSQIDTAAGGCYFEPTILQIDKAENPATMQEIFGPVLTVQAFDEDEEGLALAQHPVFGLSAAVHTRSIDRAIWAATALDSGRVWVNHYGPVPSYNQPAFARLGSGIGCEGGMEGVGKYMKSKSIRIALR
jgi:aldehyde dehydrogenase (NAD+)